MYPKIKNQPLGLNIAIEFNLNTADIKIKTTLIVAGEILLYSS